LARQGRFANGVEFAFTTGENCTTFIGERGRIMIARGYLKADPVNLLREALPLRRDPLRANTTGFHHTADFRSASKREKCRAAISKAPITRTISAT
jgi:hypothetical protein